MRKKYANYYRWGNFKKHPWFKRGEKEGLEKAKREAVINLHQAIGWNAEKNCWSPKFPTDFVKEYKD